MANEGDIPSVKDLASSGKPNSFLSLYCVLFSFALKNYCVIEHHSSCSERDYARSSLHLTFEHFEFD
jgi:hypothetical protein